MRRRAVKSKGRWSIHSLQSRLGEDLLLFFVIHLWRFRQIDGLSRFSFVGRHQDRYLAEYLRSTFKIGYLTDTCHWSYRWESRLTFLLLLFG